MDLCWSVDWGETSIITKFVTLYKALELTSNIRLRRLQWVGHMTRMKNEGVPQNAPKGYLEGRGSVGRPRGR